MSQVVECTFGDTVMRSHVETGADKPGNPSNDDAESFHTQIEGTNQTAHTSFVSQVVECTFGDTVEKRERVCVRERVKREERESWERERVERGRRERERRESVCERER